MTNVIATVTEGTINCSIFVVARTWPRVTSSSPLSHGRISACCLSRSLRSFAARRLPRGHPAYMQMHAHGLCIPRASYRYILRAENLCARADLLFSRPSLPPSPRRGVRITIRKDCGAPPPALRPSRINTRSAFFAAIVRSRVERKNSSSREKFAKKFKARKSKGACSRAVFRFVAQITHWNCPSAQRDFLALRRERKRENGG